MKRFLIAFGASTLALVVVVALAGLAIGGIFGPRVAAAQPFGPGLGGPMGGPLGGNLPQEIRDLHNLPPAERFSHMLGGVMRFTDTNGQVRTLAATPGTVVSLADDQLTIAPNDQSGNKTYTLGDQTVVHKAGQPWAGGQAEQATAQAGDKVVVVTLDGSETAHAVMIGGPDGFGPRHGFGPRDGSGPGPGPQQGPGNGPRDGSGFGPRWRN